jgi:hypothetical protein
MLPVGWTKTNRIKIPAPGSRSRLSADADRECRRQSSAQFPPQFNLARDHLAPIQDLPGVGLGAKIPDQISS